ncbi:hypothetical protein H2248_010397 [Termitomyces sp. 'cryptogamus']|nr:hypothetical protein H2248_010397 [Termitomyces sp. 'cryptogamus']
MARSTIDDVVRRLEGHTQKDLRPPASWVQIVLTRRQEEISFPRVLDIIDEILERQHCSSFVAWPIHHLSDQLCVLGRKRRSPKEVGFPAPVRHSHHFNIANDL